MAEAAGSSATGSAGSQSPEWMAWALALGAAVLLWSVMPTNVVAIVLMCAIPAGLWWKSHQQTGSVAAAMQDENLGLPPPKSAIRSSAVSRKGSIAEPSRQSPAVTSGAVNSNAAGNATVLNGNTVTPQQGQPTAANAEVGGNLAADSSTIAPQPASVAPSTTAKAAADAPAPAPAAAPKASAAPGSTQVALESKAWTTSAPPGAAPVPVVASPVLKPAATAAPTAASNGPAAAAPTASEPVALTGSAAILAKLRSQRAAGGGSSTAGSTTAATPAAKLTVLYASQTGTAQEIARTIHAESASRGMLSEVMSMNELGFDNLSAAKTPVVVVIASSTGDGDPPDNAAATYVALKKSWPSDRLAGIHFTVLGLGDSNYTRFMHVPRAIKNRFLDLGATCFYPCIEADEVDGLEDKVDPWCESLYAPVQKALQGEKPQQQHQQAAADGVPAGTAVAGKANAPAANNIQHHQQGALAAGPSQAANGSLSSEQSNALFAAVMHEEASDEAGDKPQVHMELSGTSSVLSRPDSLLGEDSAKVTSKAPAKSASTLDSPAVVATAGRLVNGLAPHGVDLKGVPPLAPCRIMLKQQVPQSVLGVAKQREWQLPSNEQKAYRDPSGIYSAEAPFWARVSDARLMTADWSDRIVIHLELDITGSNMQYASGDAVGVLPQNSVLMVSGLLTRLGLDGDTVFEIQPASGDTSGHGLLHHIPWPCTLRHAFTNCTDLTSVPRKSLLRLLAEHCKDQDEQRTLLYFTSRAGREAYAEEITRGQPSLLDLLRRFPSCQPPIGALLDTLPPLAPRMYSLSCAPVNGKVPGACGPNRVQFALSVVEFATKYGTRHGVATTWLANLCRPWLSAEVRKGTATQPQVYVPVFLRRAVDFRPPASLATPLIMIGPGTGVAPFRGFLQQRLAHMQASGDTRPAEVVLYFGCRNPDEDYLYEQDWEDFAGAGVLQTLRVAFSRKQETKVYVQHLMREDARAIAQLIKAGAHVYVCGDGAQMAKDVHVTIAGILRDQLGLSDVDALAELQSLAKAGRYVRDIWS